MAASLSYNNWLRYKNVLDAFKSSGISVTFFFWDIIQFSGEFEAKHAVLINEVLDNAENLFLAFVQHPRSSHASTDWTTIFSTTRVGSRETEEPGRTQDRSKDRCLRQVNCLPNLAWTKAVWRCRLRVCVPIGLQMPVFMTCENFCQAIKAGAVGCRPVCWTVLNGSSPLCLPCYYDKSLFYLPYLD